MRAVVKLRLAAVACITLVPALAGAGPERRCGWLQNPTPANWWLTDRDGEWVLSEQGGYQAPGLEQMPDMTGAGWVETNSGGHGYGCACLTVVLDRAQSHVSRLLSSQPLPLARCRNDKSLPKP